MWWFLICGRIVDKINSSIGQDPNSSSLIGVLDIYGFESFKINRYIMVEMIQLNRRIKCTETILHLDLRT